MNELAIFTETPNPQNAVALAIADHRAGPITDWTFVDQLRKAEERLAAYPKLVAAIKEIVDARDLVRTSVQHFHKNRAEVRRDTDAAAAVRALLRELGEVA